jgi:predicted tellurium resistance membrane protein TerC
MEHLLTSDALIAFLTLAAMEIVLGIDNVVFISILSARLPADKQPRTRRIGLAMALITRLVLLFAITWIMGLTRPLFSVFGHGVSGRDLILIAGGLFLMFKAAREVYEKLEVPPHEKEARAGAASVPLVVAQIMLLDVVFSLDSVITAVGMADEVAIMVAAMVVAMVVMLVSMETLSAFVERHPSIKILALSFLLLIGVMLVAEGTGRHVEKGYIYFAMAFSLGIELLNMRYRRRQQPLQLHRRFEQRPAAG